MPPFEQSPAPAQVAAARPAEDESAVPLRLAVSHGRLGIELYRDVPLDPLRVSELNLTLPGLKFPVDLSGGVAAFRHRRGELQRVTVAVAITRLRRHFARSMDSFLGTGTVLDLWPLDEGIGVGLVGEQGALAFDLLFCPSLGDARFVVSDARVAGLAGPALGFALRALDTALPREFVRKGRVVRLSRAAHHLARMLLPAVGARVPAATSVNFGALARYDDELCVSLDASFGPPPLGAAAARAVELAGLVADADDAIAGGDLEAARRGYIAALERAPRHPELSRSVAEIDAHSGNRAEAALGLLLEALPVTRAGAFVADLLAERGDRELATDALSQALERERYAPLAALCWARFAELCSSGAERMTALDHAVARAPAFAKVRWARLVERIRLADVDHALADAQHLEAAARGPRQRHEVCMRVAAAFAEASLERESGRWYERALRYVPDAPEATAGLARALAARGNVERAYALFERAVITSEQRGVIDADALTDLALLLADALKDLPQAVARVRQVPASATRAAEARYLEGKWRAAVGDDAGASLAYARLRDTVELRGFTGVPARFLMEAARHELEVQDDAIAAERHLAVAMRLAPRDGRVARAYRDVAARITDAAKRERRGEPALVRDKDDDTSAGEDSD